MATPEYLFVLWNYTIIIPLHIIEAFELSAADMIYKEEAWDGSLGCRKNPFLLQDDAKQDNILIPFDDSFQMFRQQRLGTLRLLDKFLQLLKH